GRRLGPGEQLGGDGGGRRDVLGRGGGQAGAVQTVPLDRLLPAGAPLVAEPGALGPAEVADPAMPAPHQRADGPRDAVRPVDVGPGEIAPYRTARPPEADEGDAALGERVQPGVTDAHVGEDEAVDGAGTEQVLVGGELVVDGTAAEQQHVVPGR